MVGYLVKDCTDCGSLDQAICDVDGVLAMYGRNGWQNVVYMTSKPTPYGHIRSLIYYRQILENLKWNQCFYLPFTMQQIVSRVGAITAGYEKIPRRPDLSGRITTTTTTTSTTSTSTTSTTSTTTSTSTSTTTSTTSTSTSTTTSTSTSTTSTSTSSTTSTTTTTTTTASPQVTVTNDATVGEVVVLSLHYDPYPPNEDQLVVGAYPVLAGSTKTANIPASFIPGKFTVAVDGNVFGSIRVVGSNSVSQCQDYDGSSSYTFTGVVVNNSQHVTITVRDSGIYCTTTTTTTTSTTTTTTTT